MSEERMRKCIVTFYDWLSKERRHYLDLWESTEDFGMKVYYGEKASTYTTIKLYLEKYWVDLIPIQKD